MKRAEITIERPLDEVYELLDDLMAHERFLDHFLTDWKLISRSPRGVGATVRLHARRAGRHDKVVVRVIKSSRRRIIEESKGGKKFRRRARGTYEFKTRRDGSTRVRFTLEFLDGARVDRLTWPIGRMLVLRGTQRGLERLKAQMEG